MHIQKTLRIAKGNNSNRIGPYPYYLIISICLVDMKVFAKFDEIPSMTLQDIKKILSMHAYTKQLRITKGNNSYRNGP